MGEKKTSKLAILTKGIIKENPVLVLVLGTCPTLATSSSAINGLGMGVSATAVLICSNIVIYYPEVFEANWDSSWQGFPTQPWTYPLTYTINDDETVSVVDCDSDYSGSVQIPSHTTYEGITRTVTSIKSNAFSDCPLLIDLIIPDTISMIEDEAFAYSSNLSGIYFKSHIPPSIGNEAFSGCPSNMILYYPEGSENEWPSSLQDFPTQSWNSFYPLTLAIINDTATIIDCAPDYSGIVTIPASIKYSGTNYNITSIEADAFLNSPLITRFYVDKDQAVYKDIEGIANNYEKDIVLKSFAEDSLSFAVSVEDEKSILAFSIPYEKYNWNIYVDGKKVDALKVNIGMLGTYISQGDHIVEIRYVPLGLKVGILVSLGTITFIVILFIFIRERKKKDK